MPQPVPPSRLDLTRLDERTVPSTVTVANTARPFDFLASGTLTTHTVTTGEGGTLTNDATAAVTLKGVVEYAGTTTGRTGGVSVQGIGTGVEAGTGKAAGDYAQTVKGQFGFKDVNGVVTSTDPLTGSAKWVTSDDATGTMAVGPQALAGSFDVSTFKLQTAWGDPAATDKSSGVLTATLRSKDAAPTDLSFAEQTAGMTADGGLDLRFTAKVTGDLVKAATRDTAVARVTATWEGDGKSEAVELDVPVYWNTGAVAVRVEDLDPPAWAKSLVVKLDAGGKLAEGDEANNTWTVTLADLTPPPAPPAGEPTAPPPVVEAPVVVTPPVVEPPPPRPTHFSLTAGGEPRVEFRTDTGTVVGSAQALAGYDGPVNLAVGDVNGDGVVDAVVAAGEGGGPQVRVINGATGGQLASFFAYGQDFRGGVSVAAADVTGDGKADIVTGAGAGGGPHVKVFDGATGRLVTDYFAYDESFQGGVGVAAVDLDGDGKAEVVTTPGAGGGPIVKVFDGTTGAERQAVYVAPKTARDGVKLEVATDPAGGMILTADAGEDHPFARFHSQLKADGPLLSGLDDLAVA